MNKIKQSFYVKLDFVEDKDNPEIGYASGVFVEFDLMTDHKVGFLNTPENVNNSLKMLNMPVNLNHDHYSRIGYVIETNESKPQIKGKVLLWKRTLNEGWSSVTKDTAKGFSVEVGYFYRDCLFECGDKRYEYDEALEMGIIKRLDSGKNDFDGKIIYTWIKNAYFPEIALVTKPYSPAIETAKIEEINLTKKVNDENLVNLKVNNNNEDNLKIGNIQEEQLMEIKEMFATFKGEVVDEIKPMVVSFKDELMSAVNDSIAKSLDFEKIKNENETLKIELAENKLSNESKDKRIEELEAKVKEYEEMSAKEMKFIYPNDKKIEKMTKTEKRKISIL